MALRAIDRLDDETRPLRSDEGIASFDATTLDAYRLYIGRVYGFVSPLERSLLDTPGLDRYLDARRIRKHLLLEHDLQTLGLRPREIDSVPQCMWIPWFEDVHTALGWAYLVEHSTLAHPSLFRQLATALPGQAAFASTYLKCYAGTTGEMWQSFAGALDASIQHPGHLDRIRDGARASYRFLRRWRNTVDGKSLSDPQGLPVVSPADFDPFDGASSEPNQQLGSSERPATQDDS